MFDEEEQNPETEEETSSTYLTLELGGQILAISVHNVREILDPQPITRLPNAPSDVFGVVDVRGMSVPIVDIKSKLGVSGSDMGDDARIVVLELKTGEGARTIGIEADCVRKVEQVPQAEIEAVPNHGSSSWDSDLINGLYRRDGDLVVLVDLDRLLGARGADLDLSTDSGFF